MTGKIDKPAVLIALFLLMATGLLAQNSTSSPYSIYGLGILSPKEDAAAAGMGHASVALAPNDWVNVTNPAAVNNLDSMTFYFNFQLKGFYAKERTDNEKQSVYSANIDGITMGFRVTKWWGACLGYAPYSTVGYSMTDEQFIIATNTKYKIKYTGSGGLSQAFINNAVTFFKHLSLGVGVQVLWGSVTKVETAMFSDVLGGEDIYNSKKYTMNNWFFEYGLQYDFNIGRNNVRLGAVYNKKTELKSSYDHLVYNDVSSQLFFDDVTPLSDEFSVPMSYTVGATYTRNRFMATADYKFSEWSKIPNPKFGETVKYRDTWQVGGGVQYTCGNVDDPFYKRLKYRLGFSYQKDYMIIRGSKFDYWGVTAGLTIPMGRWSNALVIAYEYQEHGTTFNGLVEEHFQNVKLSLNIRETWFKKVKFD